MSISPSRLAAYDILTGVDRGIFSSDLLSRHSAALDSRNAGLAEEIAMGVLRWRSAIDYLIAHLSGRPVTKLDREVRTALRMGIYQLRWLDRVPPHAAINESVELIKHARKLPQELFRSLTWDRGSEMAQHQRFTLATDITVYFCDPYNPWQRGSNENTNGLLRQYFPKGSDLSVHSQAHLNKVARQLNERPRETLQFETPAERFNACVASIG